MENKFPLGPVRAAPKANPGDVARVALILQGLDQVLRVLNGLRKS